MNWYYADQGRQVGPFSEEDWQTLVSNGTIQPDTFVWHEGLDNWRPYGELADSAPTTAVSQTEAPGDYIVCSECGNAFPPGEVIRYGTTPVCANCKPVFVQKLREGAPVETTLVYAGFWIRFVAKLLDGLIVGVPVMVIYFLLMFPSIQSGEPPSPLAQAFTQILFYAIGAGYNTFFVGRYAATPGKMALGLRVVTAESGRVSYLRALGRYFAEILSGLICYIGYIIAAFDEQKRTLHDHICNTRVIRT